MVQRQAARRETLSLVLAWPANPQSLGLVLRPCPNGRRSSRICKVIVCPRTSARVYPKNQPSSYRLDPRRCPPELGAERYVTPVNSTFRIWCTCPAMTYRTLYLIATR